MMEMPDQLTINGVEYVRADLVGAEGASECARQECTYYTHYLVHYNPEHQGAKLEHAPYHVAEQRCEEAQQRAKDWMDAHPGKNLPEAIEKLCERWERKIAA